VPTNYQRGRAFEYRTRDKLKKMGAAYVMRAAQSKGAVDLLALWPGHPCFRSTAEAHQVEQTICPADPWLVQCKYSINGGGTISPAERQALRDLAQEIGAVPVVATPGKNGRGVKFVNLNTQEPIG
jgi:hypothetical protein